MRKATMFISFLFVFLASIAYAQAPTAPSPQKKVPLTPEEIKILQAASAEFDKTKKLPPPSENMQMKMQSSVPEPTTSGNSHQSR